jgi:hypothetical protein
MADSLRCEKAQGVDVGFAGTASYALTTGFTGLRRLTLRNEEAQLVWHRKISERRSRSGREYETPQISPQFQLGISEIETVRRPEHRPSDKE